jgi:N-acetylglucosamine-6-phosphate deacetylase
MQTCIRGGRIVTPQRVINDAVVMIEDDKIMAIEPVQQIATSPAEMEVVDAEGLLVLPGLIDIHVHGSAGYDVMDATPESLVEISRFLLRQGVTAYLPTTITNPAEALDRVFDNIADTRAVEDGAQPLGVHMEGPYLNPAFCGAQPAEWLRNPDAAVYQRWLSSGMVRSVTVAPELPGALEFIHKGISQGIRFSAGHTAASYEQMREAVESGLTRVTHTFNGMPGLHHRNPGVLGAALTDERVFCEVIADGVHVHPAVLQLLVRVKGAEGVILVTDAMRAAGLEDGEYDLGGQKVSVQSGVARTAAGGLAGSTLTLNRAIANMIALVGLPLNEAVMMATASPAAALGLSGRKGVIQPGADADLILVDSSFNLKTAFLAGKRVYASN